MSLLLLGVKYGFPDSTTDWKGVEQLQQRRYWPVYLERHRRQMPWSSRRNIHLASVLFMMPSTLRSLVSRLILYSLNMSEASLRDFNGSAFPPNSSLGVNALAFRMLNVWDAQFLGARPITWGCVPVAYFNGTLDLQAVGGPLIHERRLDARRCGYRAGPKLAFR